MEQFAVQWVPPPVSVVVASAREIAAQVARAWSNRRSERRVEDWDDLSRKRLGVVRTPREP